MTKKYFLSLLFGGGVALLAACASTSPKFLEGRRLLVEGRVEEGLSQLEDAVRSAPDNAEYRAYLFTQRERAVNQWLSQALTARIEGRYDQAEKLYQRARKLAPNDQRIAAGLDALATDRRLAGLIREAGNLLEEKQAEKAQVLLRRVLAENPRHSEARALMKRVDELLARDVTVSPKLKSLLTRPITLEFRDASLQAVFEVISRSAGINFVLDREVRPDLKTTIFVRNTPIEEALQIILVTSQLERKVLSDNSILVYPNTPAKQREYQELVMKSFYLANTDVKQAGNMVRALLKTRDLFVDERLNLLMIRDTPEVVRMAEKLIASQDLAEPEVLLEVEVLEVSRGRLEALGVQWPKQIGYGILQGGTTTQSNVPGGGVVETTTPGTTVAPGVINLRNPGGITTFIANPALLINLNDQDTTANVLANPRIRVKNREKARVHIGDKVPVLTSTATATGFVSQSITYLDVGVKLDVEANVGLEDSVSMKVGLEVSSIVREVTNTSGTVAYQVGTRSAGTVLRLKDGETQVLAGLIQDEDRRSASKVPGLGDLPVLGRLFSSNNDSTTKTEIVLLITPRIVRSLTFPPASVTEFAAGTEGGASHFVHSESPGSPPSQGTLPPLPPSAPATPSLPLAPAAPGTPATPTETPAPGSGSEPATPPTAPPAGESPPGAPAGGAEMIAPPLSALR